MNLSNETEFKKARIAQLRANVASTRHAAQFAERKEDARAELQLANAWQQEADQLEAELSDTPQEDDDASAC